jgi:hypothetical protein
MTTTRPGGKITGILALTFATDLALESGDYVQVIGEYKVGLANGTKPVVGRVSVAALRGTSSVSSYTVARPTTGSQVTVEALGFAVATRPCGGAITAGAEVGVNSASAIVPVGTGVASIGIALTSTTTAGQMVDILEK